MNLKVLFIVVVHYALSLYIFSTYAFAYCELNYVVKPVINYQPNALLLAKNDKACKLYSENQIVFSYKAAGADILERVIICQAFADCKLNLVNVCKTASYDF